MPILDFSNYKILIVDDNATNVLLARTIIKRQGYQTSVAHSGKETLAKIKQDKPDLILLDVMMPEMNGFEVAKIIKDDPELSDIIIIFLTALDETKDEVVAFKQGGNDFIHKPIQSEILITRISHQIRQIHAMRTIVEQQRKLELAISSRDSMYSIISHDLRSPLATLKMLHNMILMNITEDMLDTDIYEMLLNANKLTDNIFNLLDNLLKWTKTQLNRLSIVRQDVYLDELVPSVIDTYEHIALEKSISIKIKSTKGVLIVADIDLLKTVIRNLLSNAIKFTAEGGNIEVSIESDNEKAYIHVKDSGVGIKEEDKEKILNDTSFTQYGTSGEEGTGLGLSLCKEFVLKNNGEFWFESTLGVGSTFSISFLLKTSESSDNNEDSCPKT